MTSCFIYLQLIGVTKYGLNYQPQKPFFARPISYAIRYSHRAHISTKKLKHERPMDGDLKEKRKTGLSKKNRLISSVKVFSQKTVLSKFKKELNLRLIETYKPITFIGWYEVMHDFF